MLHCRVTALLYFRRRQQRISSAGALNDTTTQRRNVTTIFHATSQLIFLRLFVSSSLRPCVRSCSKLTTKKYYPRFLQNSNKIRNACEFTILSLAIIYRANSKFETLLVFSAKSRYPKPSCSCFFMP